MTAAADSHDLIRVVGARENNLKDVSVELPKRRLTVFTGVSGSGKSSLVFDTIAAESQRLINEPYSGPPTAFAFNVPTRRASGVMSTEKGGRVQKNVVREAVYQGGMCPRCEGMGALNDFDLTAVYDGSRSLRDGGLLVPGYSIDGWYGRLFVGIGLDLDKPIGRYTKKELDDLLYKEPTKIKVEGVNLTYEGVIPKVQKSMLSKDVESLQPHVRRFVERVVTFTTCPDCDGTRLSTEARSSKIGGRGSADVCTLEISDLADRVRGLDEPSVAPLLAGLQHLLDSFTEIGLGYLSLDRPAGTLSGGEAQRTKMIRHLGSSLTDVTYVFDEPTIGLHPHDIQRMNDLLLRLRDKGNTVLVVEHEPETIAIADHAVDLGPGAGTAGGTVCFEGTVEGLRTSGTVTGRHLDDRARLKETVRLVDQGAIRGWRGSNRATYTGLLEPIRKAFARANGVEPALFSSNSEGACPACNGAGVIYTELGVMATVESTCEECEGRRFQASVLEYTLGGRNIAEVLAMSVTEAEEFFGAGEARTPAAATVLGRLADVGLGYLTLGQPLSTLSGGERQRIKLAAQMADKGDVYVLDEPTTGLHLADVENLLALLDRLVDSGKSVVVIEHHQAVMAHADWIIDLGPGAGHDGGRIVFEGTPADLVAGRSTLTGEHLAAYVNG